jgi:nuclear protein 1
MEDFFDKYEHYNFDKNVVNGNSRKGRTKREASLNTNRFNPGGNERKIVEKFRNTERNRRPKTIKK